MICVAMVFLVILLGIEYKQWQNFNETDAQGNYFERLSDLDRKMWLVDEIKRRKDNQGQLSESTFKKLI